MQEEKSLTACLLLWARIQTKHFHCFVHKHVLDIFPSRTGLTWSSQCLHQRNMKMRCTYSCILPHNMICDRTQWLLQCNLIQLNLALCSLFPLYPMKKAINCVNGSQWWICCMSSALKQHQSDPLQRKRFFKAVPLCTDRDTSFRWGPHHPPTSSATSMVVKAPHPSVHHVHVTISLSIWKPSQLF